MKPPELITENRKNGRQEPPIHPIRHLPMEQFRKKPCTERGERAAVRYRAFAVCA